MCFGCKVPEEMLDLWRAGGKEHVIGIVELYACVVALNEWKGCLKDQRVILFIDNYGAQDCLIKGSAAVDTWRHLLIKLEQIDDSVFSNLWVTRVASSSNPADFPSRGSLAELAFLGPLQICSPSCPMVVKSLARIC